MMSLDYLRLGASGMACRCSGWQASTNTNHHTCFVSSTGTQSNTPLETGANIGGAVADTSSINYDQSGYEQGTSANTTTPASTNNNNNNNRQGLAGRE
jgi:hypothetical protein